MPAHTPPASAEVPQTGLLPTLAAIIAEHFDVEPETIQPSTLLTQDLRADSLDRVELAFAIEDALATELPENAFAGWTTVGDIAATVQAAQNAQPAPAGAA